MSVRAMKNGATDFLTKPFRDQDLLDAIQRALDQDRKLSQELRKMASLQQRYATLTPREREVMTLVAAGKLNKQIAAELGTSECTVKIQRSRVMNKMQADSTAALIGMVQTLGLVHRE